MLGRDWKLVVSNNDIVAKISFVLILLVMFVSFGQVNVLSRFQRNLRLKIPAMQAFRFSEPVI